MSADLIDPIIQFLGIVGTIIGGYEALKRGFTFASTKIMKRHQTRVWPVRSKDKLLIVCPLQPDVTQQSLPTTHHDALAAMEVMLAATKRGVDAKILLASQLTDQDIRQNMFLICGPVGNAMTAKFLDRIRLPFTFKKSGGNGYVIVDGGEHVAHPTADSKRDFALIAKTTNPWGPPGTWIFLAAGIHGLGTTGSASYLVTRFNQIAQQLRANGMRERDNFAAVLECSGDEFGFPLNTKVVAIAPV